MREPARRGGVGHAFVDDIALVRVTDGLNVAPVDYYLDRSGFVYWDHQR